MKVLRHPYRPSGQGAYVDLSGIMVEVTETDRNGTPKTYVTEDVNEFWTERIMSTYSLKDPDAIKGFPLYHKRGAPGVSATVIVPAVLPLISAVVGGRIPVVYEDDIDIKGDGVVITGVWDTTEYNKDAAVVTASGGSVYPFNAGALIPFPSGFPSVILDPAQGGVRLYGLTQDRIASGAGTAASGFVATGGSYYLAPVDKIWMVQSAAVKAGTEPQFPRWHELNDVINSPAVPTNAQGWYNLFANSELTVTYYDLVRPAVTTTRDINWNHYMAQAELYRMSKAVNANGNTVSGGSIIFPDMTKGIDGSPITTGVNIYNGAGSAAFIPPAGSQVRQGTVPGALNARTVDGVPVGNITGYLRPRTEWPIEGNNAMHRAVRVNGSDGDSPFSASPGNIRADWSAANNATLVPVASGVLPAGSMQRSRADMSGLLLGRPVFGDVRDPLRANAPRVQFYYFGSLVTVPVNPLTISSFEFVSRDANNARPALTIRVSRAPTLADWDSTSSEVNPIVVGNLIDTWYRPRATFGTGDNSTTAELPSVMLNTTTLNGNAANWNVNTADNILNPSRLIPTTPETGTAIAGTVQNWYTLTIPNDEQGNLVLPSAADFNAIQRGERLTFNVSVQFNLATPITGRVTDPAYTAGSAPTLAQAPNTIGTGFNTNQRIAYWELPRPLVRTVTVTLVKDF